MDTVAIENSKILFDRLKQLKSDCKTLASELSSVAAELKEGRFEQLKDAADKILSMSQNFSDFTSEAVALSESTSMALDVGRLTSLEDLENILQSFHIQMQQEALRILDEVQSIVHKDNKDFKSLRSCHEQAKALQQSIMEVGLPELHEDVPALLNGVHPFNELLLLIRHHRNLDEERIEELEDRIQNSFGRLLFLAIVRDKLDFSTTPVEKAIPSATTPEKAPLGTKTPDESQNIREFSFPTQKRTGAVEGRGTEKAPEFPRAETILQQPSTDRRESVSRQPLKKDKSEEMRSNIQKDITQTKSKLQRALKYGFIQAIEYDRLAAIVQDVETSLPNKVDFVEDQKSLLAVRTALEEQEESVVEGRRLAMREEFQQIKNS